MDREKLIQVSFQIPPSALDSLSRLAEQMRMLAEAANAQTLPSGAAKAEHGASGSFDQARFQALRESAALQPQAVRAAVSETEDAKKVLAPVSEAGDAEAVSGEVHSGPPQAESAGSAMRGGPNDPTGADTAGGPRRVLPEEGDVPLPPAEPTPRAGPFDGVPAVHAEAETSVPRAPEAGWDIEQLIPGPERGEVSAEERQLAPAAAQGGISGNIELPVGVGAVVQARPETPRSRWSGVAEELVVPGPAPLTAEAVSLAFERDGRRYDNGFPLY